MFDEIKTDRVPHVIAADAADLPAAGFSNLVRPFSVLTPGLKAADGVDAETQKLVEKLGTADETQLASVQAEMLKALKSSGEPLEQQLFEMLKSNTAKGQTWSRVADLLEEYNKAPSLDRKGLESCLQSVFARSSCAKDLIAIKSAISHVVEADNGKSISDLVDMENLLRRSDPEAPSRAPSRILLSENERRSLQEKHLDAEKEMLLSLSQSLSEAGYSVAIRDGDSRVMYLSRVDADQGKMDFVLHIGKTMIVLPSERRLERLVGAEQAITLEAVNEYGKMSSIEAPEAARLANYLSWIAVSPALQFRVTDPGKFKVSATHHLDLNEKPDAAILEGLGIRQEPVRIRQVREDSL